MSLILKFKPVVDILKVLLISLVGDLLRRLGEKLDRLLLFLLEPDLDKFFSKSGLGNMRFYNFSGPFALSPQCQSSV